MKKLVLAMAGLLLIGTTAMAQDKEAIKAQKAAMKEAESTLKKAKSTYETSIPNPQYGRKETDFAKLATALPLIESAMANEYTKDNMDTWQTAADISYEFYKKLETNVKADPDNEKLKQQYIDDGIKLTTYCVKFDSLLALDTKIKPEEKAKIHQKYQVMGVNPALQLLQAAQNASNNDDQEELKKGAQYSEAFLNVMEKSHLMSDFKNENLADWKTYAKAFRAQSYLHIEGAPEDVIVSAYKELIPTKYKANAYQSLANYYRETDKAKQNQYLQEGLDALKDDPEMHDTRAGFAMILMQNLYRAGDKEGFKKIAEVVKTEFADNENAINAYLMEAEIAFEAKDYKAAKDLFLTAKEKYPDDTKSLLMAARCAWMWAQNNGSKKPDMDEAIKLFKQVEKETPEDPENWGEALYILYNNTQQMQLAAPYKKYYKPSK